jgi:putative ABC transport system permease protein
MDRLRLDVRYSVRHLWREKQRTVFALFCVAAGVAAIVGLQMLGLSVTDALTSNAQASNRGDVTVGPAQRIWFTADQMAAFEQLVADGQATDWTYRCFRDGFSVSVVRPESIETFRFLSVFLVEPDVYPFYGQVLALDPCHAPLAELLTDPGDVAISKNLADRGKITVGDQLRIDRGSSQTLYTVRGIVSTGSAAWTRNSGPLMDGFLYLDYSASLEAWGLERTATEVFFITEDETAAATLAARAAEIAPLSPTRTAADVLAQNESISISISRFILPVGLLALLIGGLGIANTMLVVVARRRLEIAVLKAVGLKGHHVTRLFLTEAALLGLAGSLVGALLGVGVSRALLGLATRFLPVVSMAWRIYPQPLVTGLAVGVAVTAAFSFLPTLAAAQVRPSLVLRPSDGGLPRSGRWQSLVAVLALTAVIGLLASRLMGDPIAGLAVAYGALVILTLLTSLLRIVVWAVEKLPSPGWVSLRLAQRGIGRHRGRSASTLLALIVGLFSVSLIVIMAGNIVSNLGKGARGAWGAALMIRTRELEAARQVLEESPEVSSYAEVNVFPAELAVINGDPGAYERRIAAYEQERGFPLTLQDRDRLATEFSVIIGRDLSSNLPHFDFAPGMGRNLTSDDNGRQVVLVENTSYLAMLKLQPGEKLTFQLVGDAQVTLEVVGVTEMPVGGASDFPLIAPLDVLAPLATPRDRFFVADVNPKRKNEAVTALTRALPEGTFVMETDVMANSFTQLIQQYVVLPIVVAGLAFFAAATMIANTAALAAMERRREIGVMKAVGVRSGQILRQMLLESGIVGLVGGLIGVGLVVIVTVRYSEMMGLPAGVNPWPILALLALAVGTAIAATLFAAWPASRQRPMDVLRYE